MRNALFYLLTIGACSLITWAVLHQGALLEHLSTVVQPIAGSNNTVVEHAPTQSLAGLLLQILSIVILANVCGAILGKLGQPKVIGEIIAGLLLGPSFLGTSFPELTQTIFPAASLPDLQLISQLGLVLFMFVVGMEMDLKLFRNTSSEAIVISHASIIFPFTLGVGLAYLIYLDFAPANVPFHAFALFMGIAMSITAFPVLARIVQERKLTKTKLGILVITCAAADDITAWCLLAIVIAIVKAGSIATASMTILWSAIYLVVMLKVVQPLLLRMGDYIEGKGLTRTRIALFFLVMLASAYSTECIGIHALFGAFVAGAIMPSTGKLRSIFIEKIEDVSLVLLLPLFFVCTGLRTHIGLLTGVHYWLICIGITAIAIVGKFLGGALAARYVGQSWRDSLSVGALMNTRGLMELVVLNVGYDLGVLSPEIFTMMVIMALVTTLMTGPALNLINRYSKPLAIAD